MVSPDELGYDPRPDLADWNGSPLPPIRDPLRLTDLRHEVARCSWRWGPPELALRNSAAFLYEAIDRAPCKLHIQLLDEVPLTFWRKAWETARKGEVSRGGYILTALRLGLDPSRAYEWPTNAHRLDWRMRSRHNDSRRNEQRRLDTRSQ